MMSEFLLQNKNLKFKIDTSAILENVRRHCGKAPMINLFGPFLHKTWKSLEDDFLRCGIKGILCSDSTILSQIDAKITKILLPGFSIDELGCAHNGILPVIDSMDALCALSNIAQMYDKRLYFLFRIRNLSNMLYADQHYCESLFKGANALPMISGAGIYSDFGVSNSDLPLLRRMLFECENSAELPIYAPLSAYDPRATQTTHFINYESAALCTDITGVFPCEITFTGHFIGEGGDHQLFRADIGLKDGLPSMFPICADNHEAEVLTVEPDHFIFKIADRGEGTQPITGYLTGGSPLNPVDLSLWKSKDLITVLSCGLNT